MKRPSQGLEDLLNKIETPGSRVIMHFVPTRIIRLLDTTNEGRTFRVEQLVQTGSHDGKPLGTWKTLSTHGSQVQGQSLKPAVEAGFAAQKELIAKLTKKMQSRGIIRP